MKEEGKVTSLDRENSCFPLKRLVKEFEWALKFFFLSIAAFVVVVFFYLGLVFSNISSSGSPAVTSSQQLKLAFLMLAILYLPIVISDYYHRHGKYKSPISLGTAVSAVVLFGFVGFDWWFGGDIVRQALNILLSSTRELFYGWIAWSIFYFLFSKFRRNRSRRN